jgi:parallel beta-helix repeat protein
VEHNVFLRCNGEGEIISNKSSHNTYRCNLFKDCRGELVLRGASNCTVAGNRFEGCSGGIRIHGTHHRVVNNVVVNPGGTGIRMGYGASVELGGIYQAVGHCVVANNTIVNPDREGILIGFNRNYQMKDWGVLRFSPYANRVERNVVVGSKAPLLRVDHAPGNVITGNLFHATDEATVPTPGQSAVFADPKFVDATAGDYRRREGDGLMLGASGEPLQAGP